MPFAIGFLQRQLIGRVPVPTTSFQGKTVIVTGSNVGLGLESCRWFVRLGAAKVILACRSVEKGKAAAKNIRESTGCSSETLDIWQLDMASYASVQAFADRVNTDLPRLDVLVANAGINASQFTVVEGNESMVTVNVVSLFLLGLLIYPKLRETATKYKTQTHCTTTASDLHEIANFKESQAPPGKIFATLNDESNFNGTERYATSKLLEILIVRQLGKLLPLDRNVIINCVSPGMCESELTRDFNTPLVKIVHKILARTTETGSRTIVWGASHGGESHGKYVPDGKIDAPRGVCARKDAAEIQGRLWEELREKLEAIHPGVTTLS